MIIRIQWEVGECEGWPFIERVTTFIVFLKAGFSALLGDLYIFKYDTLDGKEIIED